MRVGMIAPVLVRRATASRTSWAVRVALAVLAAASAASAACGRDVGRAPQAKSSAAVAGAAAPPPELPPSLVEAPVRYELAPAIDALERAVPRTIGNLEERRAVPGHDRLSYAFVAERAPFDVAVRGNTVTVSSIVSYHARGWLKPPIGPAISGACGKVGNDAPRVRIVLTSTVHLASDWTLRAHTRFPTVEPASADARDRCRVTLVNLDVTDKVVAAVRTGLEGKAALLDARVRKLDVRSRVGRWWALVGRPIRLRDDLWLTIRPESVRVGALRGDERSLVAPLSLTARPQLVTGPRPDSSTAPLPDITPGAPGNGGLHLLLDAALDYDAASRMLSRQLVGRQIERAGHNVRVRDARVFAAQGGRVAVALGLAGDVDARVVLVGRPVYDSTTGTLRIPDLDFAVADASLLVRAADQAGHDALRDALRERAQWPVTALLDSARARAERAMNRELTRGVRLSARIDAGKALGVYATAEGLRVRAAAGGHLGLDVERAPTIKRRDKPRTAPVRPVVPTSR
jgi:hypothetical protein